MKKVKVSVFFAENGARVVPCDVIVHGFSYQDMYGHSGLYAKLPQA